MAQFAKGIECTGNITGDPLMMLIPPREQFLTNYTIINLWGFYSNWVNVVAPDYALGTIYQDGVLIPDTAFTPVGATNYYVAQRSVTYGTHTFTSVHPFGVFVYGWELANSYGYPGGCAMAPVVNVNSILLSPDTSYGPLNITNVCLTATVTDSLGDPVAGVLVTFYVAGIAPLTGNGYTDSLGTAQYCYTQTGSIPGTDQVTAQVSDITSNTVVVFWSVDPPCVNPTSGGIIGDPQAGCEGFPPFPLVNVVEPAGYLGILEYKWQSSTSGPTGGFSDIQGSNASSYHSGPVFQTTWFKRLARVDRKPDWSGARESNVIELTVIPPLPVGIEITASDSSVCQGTTVVFSAIPLNGGASPSFQWQVNGIYAGTLEPYYTYIPADGDTVICILYSDYPCPIHPDAPDTVILAVNPERVVADTVLCYGTPYYAGGQWHTEPGIYIDTLPVPVECVRYIETRYNYTPPIPLDLGPDANLCMGSGHLRRLPGF